MGSLQHGQDIFEIRHGIGTAQQSAGSATQGLELLHFTVVGQNQQNRQGQQTGVQPQNGAELLAVHIFQFLSTDDDIGL